MDHNTQRNQTESYNANTKGRNRYRFLHSA